MADNFSNSVYIGANTKVSALSVTNENVFGYNAIGSGSNTVTIGNSSITDNHFTGVVHTPTISHDARVGGHTSVGAGNYTVLLTDYAIFKTAITGGGDTITLPAAPPIGQIFVIKDMSSTAGTNNITIDTPGIQKIDAGATATISTNFGSLTVMFDGNNYGII